MKHSRVPSTSSMPDTTTIDPAPKKHHHTALVVVLVVLLLAVLVPVLLASWFGLVPGLSALMGAKKAKDLGVSYTQADFASYQQKTAVQFKDYSVAPQNPEQPGELTIFADPKTVSELPITQEELTAAINESNWLYMPLTNTQVRITEGNIEISGNLNIDNIQEFVRFIGGTGNSQADVDNAISWAKTFVGSAPVYLKANASVQDNKLSMQLMEAQIGRFSIPLEVANNALTSATTNMITRTDYFDATSVKAVDGALLFTGTYPTTIYVKTQ